MNPDAPGADVLRYFVVVDMMRDALVRFNCRRWDRFMAYSDADTACYEGGYYCTEDGAQCDAACRGAGRCLA